MKLLVDATVFITLAEIGAVLLLDELDGDVVVPQLVADEIQDEPARTELDDAQGEWIEVKSADEGYVEESTKRLGREGEPRGDAALLGLASEYDDAVVVTDDKPLRNTCKALGVSPSGSVGVIVASVEEDILAPEEAKELLVTMDEVGARFSASLLRKAEDLIDGATNPSR
jgi:predicted nucleic acid-binding protein